MFECDSIVSSWLPISGLFFLTSNFVLCECYFLERLSGCCLIHVFLSLVEAQP